MPHSHHDHPTTDPMQELFGQLRRSARTLADLTQITEELRDTPQRLGMSIKELLKDGSQLDDVASRSYIHSNGFAKIVMHGDDECSVRLHVWRRHHHPAATESDPHGHRWEFASWIVAGALHETAFEVSPYGEPFDSWDYSRGSDATSPLTRSGSENLLEVGYTDHLRGAVYARSQSALHTVWPPDGEFAATLVVRGPKSFDPTPVYLPPGTIPDHQERRLSVDELTSMLIEVAAEVE